jgi:hypothetical protein
MKTFAIRTLLVAAAVIALAAQAARAQVDVNVTVGGFYDELTPYGQWVDCSYGQCWVPAHVDADWQPYSNGQWIYTEYGWTWVSSDPWGGNPYHYGTWASIEGHRWAWVPGTVWAPAWVTWSYSNNYVGWAPLPPTVVFGASGYSGSPVIVSRTQYVFVPTNHFVGTNVQSVRISSQQSAQIFAQTRPVTGFAVSGGIVRNTALPMATIERAHGGKIETRSIQAAGPAPRAMSAGNTHLAVVAPASEVRAAAAARPQAAHGAPAVDARHPAAQPQGREAKAPDAPSADTHRPAAQQPAREAKAPAARPQPAARPEPSQDEKHAKAPADRQPENAKARKPADAPPAGSQRPEAQAPADHREPQPRPAEASRPAEHAPKPKPQPAREKPEEKDKKPDGDKP